MRQILLLLSILSFATLARAQKMYVWCPENNQIKARIGLGNKDTINVVVFDGRSLSPKNKIECTSEQLIQTLLARCP
jgi:hypothetical protein